MWPQEASTLVHHALVNVQQINQETIKVGGHISTLFFDLKAAARGNYTHHNLLGRIIFLTFKYSRTGKRRKFFEAPDKPVLTLIQTEQLISQFRPLLL